MGFETYAANRSEANEYCFDSLDDFTYYHKSHDGVTITDFKHFSGENGDKMAIATGKDDATGVERYYVLDTGKKGIIDIMDSDDPDSEGNVETYEDALQIVNMCMNNQTQSEGF